MFDSMSGAAGGETAGAVPTNAVPTNAVPAGGAPTADAGAMPVSLVTADVVAFMAALAEMTPASSEVDGIERVRVLERLKSVCAAAQAREAVAVEVLRRDAEAARGVPVERRGRGLGAEIALARGESPTRGGRHLGLARALVGEMPHTMAALTAGEITEWRATLVAKETAWLPVEGRRHIDAALADELTGTGDRRLAGRARALAQAWDPAAAVAHLAQAHSGRRVWTRPAPDAMVYLTALVPLTQGIGAYATLDKLAQTTIAEGKADGRTRAQIMADTLITRLTGRKKPDAVPVEVHLVMTDTTLLNPNAVTDATTGTDAGPATRTRTDAGTAGTADDGTDGDGEEVVLDPAQASAWLVGHGPIPAPAVRDLLHPDHGTRTAKKARVWLRRLYAHPETGQLVAMDTRRRRFPATLRRMLILRDDTCRTPWCDAPIRHTDHATPHHRGGPTSYANGSGLCERCNQTKEADDWHHHATPTRLDVTTPTGHTYPAPTPPILHTSTRTAGPKTALRDHEKEKHP